jgi:hypothetical protein
VWFKKAYPIRLAGVPSADMVRELNPGEEAAMAAVHKPAQGFADSASGAGVVEEGSDTSPPAVRVFTAEKIESEELDRFKQFDEDKKKAKAARRKQMEDERTLAV